MINPRTIAQEIAYADVATQAANLQEKQTELDAESSGLDSLSSALSDFQSAVDALNSDTDGPVTFAATSNNDSATVSANSQAQAGSYSFFVEQLAQGQQTTFSMGDDAFSATGTFELTMGDSTMDIDLSAADQNGDGDGFIDASELVNAINRRIEIMVLTKSASDTLYQYFGQHGDKVVQPLVQKLDKQHVLSQRTR